MNTIPGRERIHGAAGDFSDETARAHALTMLDEIRACQERARLHRIYYMQLARTHGCTNQEIGDALGIGEAAVRAMLTRAGDLP
ncbi:hypothetical protein [Rhodococcus jostii]|uniref:hypothetical protein n=1 Tax=Rhodococcus jostii TaxID=132919 RepID=UPI00363EDECD